MSLERHRAESPAVLRFAVVTLSDTRDPASDRGGTYLVEAVEAAGHAVALRDLRNHDVDLVTLGQYLQPTAHHHPVLRYWTPEEFEYFARYGDELGFTHMASGPLVRSSYHADQLAGESGLLDRK